MSYATKQAMIERYGSEELIELTDRSGVGVINDGVLDAALEEADAEINSYLQSRYALPLASVPLLIAKHARDITRYNLYDDNPPDTIESRYKSAVASLKAIANGGVHLGLDAQANATPTDNLIKISGPARTFERLSMQDY